MANTSPTTPTLSSQKLRFERTGTGPISTNLGSGAQTNSTQTGGRNNRMFYVRDYHEHRSGACSEVMVDITACADVYRPR